MRSVDQLSDLATVSDGDLLGRRSASASEGLDLVDDVHAVDDLAEDDVPPVEPGGGHGRDEELRSVGVRAGVGHGEHAGAGVLELEVLDGFGDVVAEEADHDPAEALAVGLDVEEDL